MLQLLPTRCVRCRGDLQVRLGLNGTDWSCIQCGYANGAALLSVPVPVRGIALTVERGGRND
jgi:hypothetical protein